MSPHPVDLDRLAQLEEEQRFLLRSLADLEREHAAGDVDEIDYATLRDGYTARAATVLRAIEDDRAALPAPRRRNPWRMVATILTVVAVAVGAGLWVARSSGQNLTTGATQPSGTLTDDDVNQMLVQARQKMSDQDVVGAFDLYSAVLKQRPTDVEANTYAAWLLVLDAQSSGAEALAQRASQGLLLLQHAIDLDPTYPDAHCLTAVVATQFLSPPDLERAKAEGQRCLDTNPPAGMRGLLEEFVTGLDGASPTTTAPSSGS
jgi:hypothetical protein